MAKDILPLIRLSGSSEQIGLMHGRLLAARIEGAIDFYRAAFKQSEADILNSAEFFKRKISKFSKNYAIEIEAIAEGANVDPLWIYALNSRTEILPPRALGECTAVYFRNSRTLGQNWDWARRMEKLAVIMRIERQDGHKILMVTEPGIIGKIGFNSAGIGVCLNILHCGKKLDGIPIHIILRAILDSKSLPEAKRMINRAWPGKSSNVLIGDSRGNYSDFEFAADKIFELGSKKPIFVHTNHYLGKSINTNAKKFASSFSRFERAQEIASAISGGSAAEMKAILLDRARKDLPICRHYVADPDIGTVGTICSVIMDLGRKKMHITRGSPLRNAFETIAL